MLKRFAFGPLTPDLEPSNSGLSVAKNVFGTANGYRPVPAPSSVTPALATAFKGGCAFVGSDGTAALLSATSSNLYRYSGTVWNSVLAVASTGRWQFSQYGDLVIGAHGGAPVKFNLTAGTSASLGGSPPNASIVATVRDFVFLAGDPAAITTVYWSSFNNAEGWTIGTNQCDKQPLPSGGEIMGIAGGEYAVVLQKNAIKRASYEGGAVIFRFDEISANVGCMAKGSVTQAGRLVFFLSERGFMLCDGNDVRPIGTQKIDRTFFARYSRDDIANITAAVDPRSTAVYWGMPGSPGTLWRYDWSLDEARAWTTIETSLAGVFPGFTSNISLDSLDALYPSGLDSIPYSLDDARFAGGNPLLFVVDSSSILNAFQGSNMAPTVNTGSMEMAPGKRVRVNRCRAISDATTGTVSLNVKARDGDSESIKVSGSIRANGDVPIRANGRHVSAEWTVPAGTNWTYVQGLDLEFEPAGTR